MEEIQEKEKQKPRLRVKLRHILAAMILLAAVGLAFGFFGHSRKAEPEIISKSTLEKILNVSDLSTFEAVYNGVAKVMNEENSQNVDYYVSYEAKVKAGIDFEQIDIEVDNENKVITVQLPAIKINDVNVDIASLDYIFENDRANTATVSEQAYKKCIEDATNESNSESDIYELAEENARNIVEALISPFVEQLDEEYQVEIH